MVGTATLPQPGDTIAGKYVLDRLLGQGGMGAVFAARHIKLGKPVAIKIMLADPGNPEASQRFVNEGRAAANIQSEHVVRVDDVDEEFGYAYMVLELLDGEDLSQIVEREPRKRLPPHVAVGFVLQALRGIAHAHALGIVHRDIKPSNLFVARKPDGSTVVKVLDFGISKTKGSALAAAPSALTSTRTMLGSPLYMSPEQLRSSKNVDPRADLWGIGVILYELMAGALPFGGEDLGGLFASILETEPQPLRAHSPDVPPPLEAIVHRCLQKRPDMRFQSADELAAALAPFAGGPLLAYTAPVTPRSALAHTSGNPQAISGAALSGPIPSQGIPSAIPSWTPQGLAQSGGWDNTAARPPTSSARTALVVAGVVVLAAVAGVGAFMVPRWRHRHVEPPVVASAPPASESASPPPVASTVASAVASTPAIASAATPAVSASASTAARTPPPRKGRPARNEPPPDPPPPQPPKPKSDNTQDTR